MHSKSNTVAWRRHSPSRPRELDLFEAGRPDARDRSWARQPFDTLLWLCVRVLCGGAFMTTNGNETRSLLLAVAGLAGAVSGKINQLQDLSRNLPRVPR
jgi:hypothetical protein